jgi:adenylylsulfate reductase subunit B
MWTVKFRNGTIKRFKFPTRTVNPGEVDIFAGEGAAEADLSKKRSGIFHSPGKRESTSRSCLISS